MERIKPLSSLSEGTVDDGTIVRLNDTQTLTNKMLSLPVINSPTIYSPRINSNLDIIDSSSDVYIRNIIEDKDIYIKVNKGGVDTTSLFVQGSTGFIGIGNTSPSVGFHVGINNSSHSLSSINDVIISGKLEVDGDMYLDGNFYSGHMEFETDSGLVTAIDMPVSSTPLAGTVEGYTFDIDGNVILKIYSEADGSGQIQNRGIHLYGETGVVKNFVYQNDLLPDDGTVNLPDAVSGIVSVTCNGEAGQWLVQEDGTVTKISGTTNTTNTDLDGYLCVYDGETFGIVKNRLGLTGRIRIIFWYN